ncbi:beta-lactamase family protein [Aspergillus costaricaensis CBS 115574]|uniref:Beta-lactamase family protein n=1 Tax=Aspergillus costaricaensis CBS 115574 TaxID=1448317 RepID=A0ACD1ITF7_9EURO|nr:beta-lactamase family protein [Aspergillus costaricaensis CBS 115574]RAK93887.1 beta-lactamase family protein [Aspergillus costaricaensis CBS 115574]
MQLLAAADAAARAEIDSRTDGVSPQIPGLVYCAVNRAGNTIFSHASGKTSLDGNSPMTMDTIFWLASCTKLVTSIACMQLVERGTLELDNSAQLESLAPELRNVQVLERTADGKFHLVPKQRSITLRMLLNHTSGFGYAFEDLKLRDWSRPVGLDDFSGNVSDVLHRPLVNQPGTKFQYGVGLDWAGVIVERASGLSLEDYFQLYIYQPLGIKDISFFPTTEMKLSLAAMHQRAKDGTLSVRDHLYRYPLLPPNPGGEEDRFCMGGAGCFGKPLEFCRIVAALLNDGTSPHTGAKIVTSETVEEIFTDQIPTMPRYCNEYTPSGKPELANPCPLIPCSEDLTEGWGLSFSLSHTERPSGRAAGSGSWEGLANLFWFADRTNGIGGIIASQILPYGDLEVINCSESVEKIIYNGLSNKEDGGCH